MGILFAFAPFVGFAIIERIVGPTTGLVAGALISVALIGRDAITPGRSPKILEIGTAVLFGSLALYALVGSPSWSVIEVRLWVDAGLLVIVLSTMALGQPFTLQYAREQVGAEFHYTPEFLRTNYVITSVWALAFAVMVAAELVMLNVPTVSPRVGVFAIIAALIGAVKFTGWYPEHLRTRVPR
jgi:hypothetical protein